tara:strand:- start:789 stop:1433 length:645 start_codon:yes stop_codon:yes gene_type:complete
MGKENVLIVDAGLGNIGSVVAAMKRLNCEVDSVKTPPIEEESRHYTHIILPGVGSFKAGITALNKSGWADWIRLSVEVKKKPLLGICLGMQLLASEGYEGMEEDRSIEGLGLIKGDVKMLEAEEGLVLPHVGWNELKITNKNCSLLDGIPEGGDMYFVHSYVFKTEKKRETAATSDYGTEFGAVVNKDKIFGVQFHPEKSQKLGRTVLENFIKH